MSIEAMNYYRSVRFGDRYPTRKLLMFLLADRADEEYSCFPSIGLLADELETDRRAVQRLIGKLMEDGYLSVEDRKRQNKSSASNRYHLHGPWDNWGGTGRPFEIIESRRKGYAEKEGNYRARKNDQSGGKKSARSRPGVFPRITEGGGYETAPGAVTRPQGGGYETAGRAVVKPPLESSEEPPGNPHPELSLADARSAALPRGERTPGGPGPSIEEIAGPGAVVANDERPTLPVPRRPAGHTSGCLCPVCKVIDKVRAASPSVPPQASGPPADWIDQMFKDL